MPTAAPPCTLSMRHSTTFQADNVFFIQPRLTSWKSVWSTAIKWGVIQQRVYQPQLYNVNELKWAYGVARWHWLKHYWQCNWRVALASFKLSMSAAHNGQTFRYFQNCVTLQTNSSSTKFYTISNIFSTTCFLHLRLLHSPTTSVEDRIVSYYLNVLNISWIPTYYSHAIQRHLLTI